MKTFVRLTRAQKEALIAGPFSLEVELGAATRSGALIHLVVRNRAGGEECVLHSSWIRRGEAIVLNDLWPEGGVRPR